MTNVIEQIVQPASFGGQTIEMTVRSNERGPQGEQGEPGEAATITAGNAYTLDYGEQPQVMNSGTSSEAKFDFYIPEGKPGATYDNFIGANGGSGGSAGLVPAPVASDNVKVLKGDGTWGTVTAAGVDKLSLLNLFYPVGSYYETSDTNFNPNTSWGGTWVEDSAGRVTGNTHSGSSIQPYTVVRRWHRIT